jgi:hypothetical protein
MPPAGVPLGAAGAAPGCSLSVAVLEFVTDVLLAGVGLAVELVVVVLLDEVFDAVFDV